MKQSRFYEIDGESYPRVSSILSSVIAKPFLATWRGKVGNQEADRIARDSTEFGTAVHAACAAVCGGPAVNPDPELAPFVEGFRGWLAQHAHVVVAAERLVVSRRWKFAGTCDLLVEMVDGSLAVCDLKTSKQLSPEYALQLAAYRAALREDGLDVTRRLVIHLPKAGIGTVWTAEYTDHDRDEWAFLHALAVFRWTESQGAKAV